jgi:uncharacterized protein YjbI with pentapeptide repeats
MTGANLKNTQWFGANLTGADLRGANLEGAAFTPKGHPYWKYLGDAVLKSADLRGANLQGAIVTTEQLSQVFSVEGAILPDGTKHGSKSSGK